MGELMQSLHNHRSTEDVSVLGRQWKYEKQMFQQSWADMKSSILCPCIDLVLAESLLAPEEIFWQEAYHQCDFWRFSKSKPVNLPFWAQLAGISLIFISPLCWPCVCWQRCKLSRQYGFTESSLNWLAIAACPLFALAQHVHFLEARRDDGTLRWGWMRDASWDVSQRPKMLVVQAAVLGASEECSLSLMSVILGTPQVPHEQSAGHVSISTKLIPVADDNRPVVLELWHVPSTTAMEQHKDKVKDAQVLLLAFDLGNSNASDDIAKLCRQSLELFDGSIPDVSYAIDVDTQQGSNPKIDEERGVLLATQSDTVRQLLGCDLEVVSHHGTSNSEIHRLLRRASARAIHSTGSELGGITMDR